MKKLFKVIVILVVIIVALLVVASVALRIYLPPEKAKALVLEHLSAQLKREVTVGSVSVGILSGLQMSDLKISESPTFAKGTFLSSDQFSLKVALAPLLFRKVVVRQIILKRPEVMITRYADGKTFNFSDLTATTTPTPPPSSSAAKGEDKSMPFLLLVSRAEIQKGAVHFNDRSAARQSAEISALDLKLNNVSLTTPFGVQTSLHLTSKGSELALSFAGEANLLEGAFKIKQASLVSQESKITVTGTVSGLKSLAPAVDLNVEIPQLNLANFKGFVAFPPELRVEGNFTGHADLSGDQKAMNFSARLDGTAAQIKYASAFIKPVKTSLVVSAAGVLRNLAELDIQNLKIVLNTFNLSGHGKIPNLKATAPAVVFHVESNAFAIEDLLVYAPGALPQGLTLQGKNQLSADISGTSASAQFAAKWDGTDLTITKADQFTKSPGQVLNFSIIGQTAGPNKIIIKNFTGKLLSNPIAGSGTYETKGTQAIVALEAKGTNWSMPDLAKVSPLLAPYHPTGTLSFDLRANGPTAAPQAVVQTQGDVAMADIKQENYEGKNLQLKWNLTQVTQDLSKVGGTASLKQGPGKIMNVDKLAAGSRAGKIALAPLDALSKLQQKGLLNQVNLPSLQSIPFDSIVGEDVLNSGIVTVKTFTLNGQALSIQDHGTVGLAGAQPLNMNVVMQLAPGSVGGTLGGLINDENGRPTLKFNVTGSVANPQVKLDVQEAGKRAVQQAGQQILKNPNVQNAVDGLLKGIFH